MKGGVGKRRKKRDVRERGKWYKRVKVLFGVASRIKAIKG